MTLREILQGACARPTAARSAPNTCTSATRREKRWLQERLESIRAEPTFSAETKKHILDRLTAAETLEKYLHTAYVGQKRFSLEGGESLIRLLDELIQRAGSQGVQEIVIGMAHRGRLNVLVNMLGKMPKDLFAEFEGIPCRTTCTSGDVKYHQGFSSRRHPRRAARCTCRWPSIPRTWKSSTRWSKARCARASDRRGDKDGDPGACRS